MASNSDFTSWFDCLRSSTVSLVRCCSTLVLCPLQSAYRLTLLGAVDTVLRRRRSSVRWLIDFDSRSMFVLVRDLSKGSILPKLGASPFDDKSWSMLGGSYLGEDDALFELNFYTKCYEVLVAEPPPNVPNYNTSFSLLLRFITSAIFSLSIISDVAGYYPPKNDPSFYKNLYCYILKRLLIVSPTLSLLCPANCCDLAEESKLFCVIWGDLVIGDM